MTDKKKNIPESQTHLRDGGVQLPGQKRLKLLACEIIFRELCHLAAQSPNLIDIEFLRKGLHDVDTEVMRDTIQKTINAVPAEDYDAVILGYARCNNGLVGVKATNLPLIIPRAHDCITFFFGGDKAYQEYFAKFPGTYFRTTGWTERGSSDDDSVMAQLGLDRSYEQYVQQYGEDNAKYIMESLGVWTENYKYLAYIEMGLPIDAAYSELAKQEAKDKELEFKQIDGNFSLLKALLNGPWDEQDFLTVPIGYEIAADDSGQILKAVKSHQ